MIVLKIICLGFLILALAACRISETGTGGSRSTPSLTGSQALSNPDQGGQETGGGDMNALEFMKISRLLATHMREAGDCQTKLPHQIHVDFAEAYVNFSVDGHIATYHESEGGSPLPVYQKSASEIVLQDPLWTSLDPLEKALATFGLYARATGHSPNSLPADTLKSCLNMKDPRWALALSHRRPVTYDIPAGYAATNFLEVGQLLIKLLHDYPVIKMRSPENSVKSWINLTSQVPVSQINNFDLVAYLAQPTAAIAVLETNQGLEDSQGALRDAQFNARHSRAVIAIQPRKWFEYSVGERLELEVHEYRHFFNTKTENNYEFSSQLFLAFPAFYYDRY